MGDTSAFGSQGRRDNNRRDIIFAELMALDENVRGNDVRRLMSLVDLAIHFSIAINDEPGCNEDFGITDRNTYDAHSAHIEAEVDKLLSAAASVEKLMDEENLAKKLPWLYNIAQFDGVCAERFEDSGVDIVREVGSYPSAVPERVRAAVSLLKSIQPMDKERANRRRGPMRQEDHILAVVKAVAIYVTEQPNLVFQRSWPAGDPTEANKGLRGGILVPVEKLSPPTRTVELIKAVLDAYRIKCDLSRVRTRLKEYSAYLDGSQPQAGDIWQ